MKPGATYAPSASTTVSPSGARPGATSATTPSRTRTSAARGGAPVPSTSAPPRTSRFPLMGSTLSRGERELRGPEAAPEITREGAGERGRVDEEPVEVGGIDLPRGEWCARLDPAAVRVATEHV